MKKSYRSYAYWALYGLLSIGILKVSGVFSNLYAFTHSLDIHANEEGIKKEAEKRMREEANARKEAQYWKEYHERQAREKKEKEAKERAREEEEDRRREEARS